MDTGGTFTDLLLLEEFGNEVSLRRLKLPSTPQDPAAAVLEGIHRLLREDPIQGDRPGPAAGVSGAAPPTVPESPSRGSPPPSFQLIHGSTVGTNALLEGRAAPVTLVTNRGFEDVLEIGRQNRPQLYALVGHRPPPPVPRERRLGIAGRLGADGGEVEPLDPDELAGLSERVAAAGGSSVAVVLLHAYRDPRHEEAVALALEECGLPVSLSSRILPEYREVERTSTTVVNAALVPVMSRYLRRLEAESGAERVHIMGSSGGVLPVDRACMEPVHTVVSGPAGGVVGALHAAATAGFTEILTFDMGGTSTDVALCPGVPIRTREFSIGGVAVAVPVIDLHTVGAGGGSVARVDPGGALRVGPRSAGAVPGPIAYARGGTEVTVTDAHVWLGRLPVEGFLGGEGGLDRDGIRPFLERLARGLGTGLEEAAEGVLEVADATVERALRVISVERGYDPRTAVIVAFGGAGGLHAAAMAGRLRAAGALIPSDPGLLSARGMLAAPLTMEAARTLLISEEDPDHVERMEEVFAQLEQSAARRLLAEGADPAAILRVRRVDARYRGQSFELTVEASRWREAFREAHRARYGHAREDRPLEAVTLRVELSLPPPGLPVPRLPEAQGPPPAHPGLAWVEGGWREIPRVWRRDLRAGHRLEGPAVVLEYSATTWVPPGWRVEVLGSGDLFLTG